MRPIGPAIAVAIAGRFATQFFGVVRIRYLGYVWRWASLRSDYSLVYAFLTILSSVQSVTHNM